MEAQRWDLIVFDEAHHLTATQSGNKVSKTQNFKLCRGPPRAHPRLAAAFGDTAPGRPFPVLDAGSACSHPTLFLRRVGDMIHNRYRLNAVVFRRTQADACDANGEPLFSRRQVHTQAFHLSEAEKRVLRLPDGLPARWLQHGSQAAGNQGRALGFVMTIFQKIAASSFAAVEGHLAATPAQPDDPRGDRV